MLLKRPTLMEIWRNEQSCDIMIRFDYYKSVES